MFLLLPLAVMTDCHICVATDAFISRSANAGAGVFNDGAPPGVPVS